MSKILAVTGATGKQGGSLINYVLNDPELSRQYSIRAIVRDVDSEKSKDLKVRGVEVVQGDLTDQASMKKALTGAQYFFLVTMAIWDATDLKPEYDIIKKTADTAVEAGVEYIIFSSLPSCSGISGGKYTKTHPFDAKAEGEKYIRTLPVKKAFVRLAFFFENLVQIPIWQPQKDADGNWVLALQLSPKTRIPWVDNGSNIGSFVGAILAEPDKYNDVGFNAAVGYYTMEDIVAIESQATGKKITYKQISPEEFADKLPVFKEVFVDAFHCADEFGYFGPGEEKSVAWAAERARSKLVAAEEFLKANPLKLE